MLVDEIIAIVKKCGNIILLADRAGDASAYQTKEGRANFVTKYDVAVQGILQEELLKIVPEALFFGEEGEHTQEDLNQGYVFIVDPIDGTTNFIKNYNKSCISVGLAYQGEIVLGVIFNPYTNEVFHAEKGKGAYLNNTPIHVTDHPLSEGLVAIGTAPYYEELIDQTFDLAKTLYKSALDIRRSGSAALDLCDVASGRCELFYECRLQPWDYAAGSLLVTEAGGKISKMNGDALTFDQGCSVLAGNVPSYDTYFKLEGHLEL